MLKMYSLPKYEEVDPTPAMMPFYLVFFGMMVADIGYGLLMLLLSIIALKAFVLPRGMKRFADFFLIYHFQQLFGASFTVRFSVQHYRQQCLGSNHHFRFYQRPKM